MLSKPWTRLYAIFPLTIGLLLLEHNLHLTPTEHKVALLFVITLIYVLVGLWINSNRVVLEDETSSAEQSYSPQALSTPETAARIPSLVRHEAGND